jgi:hypothetical protein
MDKLAKVLDASPANASHDYAARQGTVTFRPGDTDATVTVTVIGDTQPEPDEFVLISFVPTTADARIAGLFGARCGQDQQLRLNLTPVLCADGSQCPWRTDAQLRHPGSRGKSPTLPCPLAGLSTRLNHRGCMRRMPRSIPGIR